MKSWIICLFVIPMLILHGEGAFCQSSEPLLPDSLTQLLQENHKSDLKRVKALSTVVNALFKNKNYTIAKPFVNEIAELSVELDNNYVKALGDYYKGSILLAESQYDDAYKYLTRAEKLASTLRDTDENTRLNVLIYASLSVYYFKSEMVKEYYVNVTKGLNLNKELQHADLDFVLKSNLAVVYLYMGKDSMAVNIDRALVEDPRYANQDLFFPYFHIGEYNMLQQNYDSALSYYNRALDYASLPEHVAWAYLKNGIIYNLNGHYDKAINILERCLDTILVSGNAEIEANARIEMGYSYYKKLSYDTALQLINKGITLARQNHYLGLEVEGLKRKTDILYNLKRYQEFSSDILTYNILKDSLNDINNLNQLSEIVFQHKINTAEEQARHDHYILETKHRQELLVFYILLILLITVVVVVLLLLNRKNILIKNRKIKEELLSDKLDLRNREMTAKVLSQVQKKELLVDIIGKLTAIEMNNKSAKNIHSIIVELRQSIEENSHVDFEYYFVQTHPDFYNNLRSDFPNLTPHELRLCAYLKMNLSTKDIAAISNISPDSARTARSRLRKTLKIHNQNENLVSFLAKY